MSIIIDIKIMSTNSKEKAFFERLSMLRKMENINKVIENNIKTNLKKTENEKANEFYMKLRLVSYYSKLQNNK